MSLDITFKHVKRTMCPRCGEYLGNVEVRSAQSGGRVWYDFLEPIGYYVPHHLRTEENDWYAKDMILTEEQAKFAYKFIIENDVYCSGEIGMLIATALFENDAVAINSDC